MQAQYTLRGSVAHFQYGNPGSYTKYDVTATPDLVAYYNQQREEGETVNSLAGGDTQYAVVEAIASKASAFEFVMTKVVRVNV